MFIWQHTALLSFLIASMFVAPVSSKLSQVEFDTLLAKFRQEAKGASEVLTLCLSKFGIAGHPRKRTACLYHCMSTCLLKGTEDRGFQRNSEMNNLRKQHIPSLRRSEMAVSVHIFHMHVVTG